MVNNLGVLYAKQGKLVEAEQMFQRALQGYEKALSADNIITYVPALNTMCAFGFLFERQADSVRAEMMYSKAYIGYEKVFGTSHARSQTLRGKIHALNAGIDSRKVVRAEESMNDLQVGRRV